MNRRSIPVSAWAAALTALGLAILSAKGFDTALQRRADPASGLEERIVFHSDAEGNAEIYSMRPDGGDVRRLTYHPADDSCPMISPDGRKIAFLSSRDGNDEIYVMDPDGGGPIRLTRTPYNEGPPRWSSDGRKIISWAMNPVENAPGNIFVMDSDGAHTRWLTRADRGGGQRGFELVARRSKAGFPKQPGWKLRNLLDG